MEHHAHPMSATRLRNATPLSARVTDAECDPQEENFPETIQLPYPEPLRPATRLFPETNLTQLRLFRNNSLGPATTGGNCLKTIHPCPATTGSNCLRTIHPCHAPRWSIGGSNGHPRIRRPPIPELQKMSWNCVSVGSPSPRCDSISIRQRTLPGDGHGDTMLPLSHSRVFWYDCV